MALILVELDEKGRACASYGDENGIAPQGVLVELPNGESEILIAREVIEEYATLFKTLDRGTGK